MKKKAIGVYAPSSPAHIWFEEKYLFAIHFHIIIFKKKKD